MIRVLNVISDRNIGGAGRCILNFLAHYDRSAFQVDVALPRGSLLAAEVRKLDTRVLAVDGLGDRSFSFDAVRALRAVIRETEPSVVHTHGAMSGRIAARQCGRAVVYTRHSVFPVNRRIARQPIKFLHGRVNEYYADAILAVAEAARENLVDAGVRAERVQVILNGVPGQVRLSEAEILAERAGYGIAPAQFVVGILARLEPVKGHSYLLEAVRQLKERGHPITLLVAGAGGELASLQRQAEALGISDAVVFAGFVPDVPRLLSILDIQVNASYGTEATSLSLLEGMSMGIPAVVTDYGGNPGVIQSEENGLLVQTCDSAALAQGIERMLTDAAGRKKMAGRCLEIFAEKFTADIYARNIEQVYRNVAGKRG